MLFLIVLGDVLREALQLHQASGIGWTMTSFLQHLDYAADICLFAHKIPELSAMVKSREVVTASVSLTINFRKTKTLSLTRNINVLVQVGGEQIEAVDKFMYLGSKIYASGGTDSDIENRIKNARSAFGILCPVWRESEHWPKTEAI